jgi:hypothetical protein
MNYQVIADGLLIFIVVAGVFVIVAWVVGVALIIHERRKPDSFITQEMKRLEDKGKNK